jgi:hypothetical protein
MASSRRRTRPLALDVLKLPVDHVTSRLCSAKGARGACRNHGEPHPPDQPKFVAIGFHSFCGLHRNISDYFGLLPPGDRSLKPRRHSANALQK